MAPSCCSPRGVRIIQVGNFRAGVTGLDQILKDAYSRGLLPDQDGLKKELVKALRAAGNYVSESAEEAYGDALAGLYREYFDEARRQDPASAMRQRGGKMKIEILGPGCARCRTTEENVRKALAELKLEAQVEHVNDPKEFARRGVMLTPGVILDGQLLSSGRVPNSEEIKTWLTGRGTT